MCRTQPVKLLCRVNIANVAGFPNHLMQLVLTNLKCSLIYCYLVAIVLYVLDDFAFLEITDNV